MKINQNKNNNILNKLCTKSFVNTKKEKIILDNSHNKLDTNKKNKTISKLPLLKNSKSTKRNIKKYDLDDKCNTLRESALNNHLINKDVVRVNESNSTNNRRSLIMNRIKNYMNQKKEKEKIINSPLKNNEIKTNSNNNNTTLRDFKNTNTVGYNKTINYIRIKNPKLNTVLNNYNDNKNNKNKIMNFYLPIRNFNTLNKNYITTNNLSHSMNKRYSNKENKKRINNSFKIKENTINKSFDNNNLKSKLKKNKSIENGYLKFYKVDKKIYNCINNNIDGEKKLKRTIIQNYKCYLNRKDELKCNTESKNLDISNDTCVISSSFDFLPNEKEMENETNLENNENKSKKNLNVDSLKLKLDSIKRDIIESQTEREFNKTMRGKMNTSLLPISSKSVQKRKKLKNEECKRISLKNIINPKENINIKKVYNNNINNSNINGKNNKYINIINNSKIINKDNNRTKENNKDNNIGIIRENFNTLPANNINFNSEIFDMDINKKNSDIFEIISNVKVKSLVEYEQDKKNSLNGEEKLDINNDDNININKIINTQAQNHNLFLGLINNKENNEKENFIKDRDEYNIILKETFSKDRFSFRPTNNDSHETFQDLKFQNNNNTLDKKDFINNNIISFSHFKFENVPKNKMPAKKKVKQSKNNINAVKKIKHSKSKELKPYKNS